MAEGTRRQGGQLMPDHRGRADDLDPDFVRAIGADLDHIGIVEPGSERLERGFDENRLVGTPCFGECAKAHLTNRPLEIDVGAGAAGIGPRFISALIS